MRTSIARPTVTRRQTLTAAGALALAAAAFGQPVATDLGALPAGETRQSGVAVDGAAIVWFEFTIPAVSDTEMRYLDIWTEAAAGDSEIGLYDAAGNRIANDDDDGASVRSALSFGATFPGRPLTDGVTHNGRDGDLAAGLYYLAIGNFPTTFNDFSWDVVSTNTTANNTFDLVLSVGMVPPPPPDQWRENPDAGEFPATAQVPAGSGSLGSILGSIATGGEVDMYEIDICDVANFSATTAGNGTTMDTQLWLFLADGSGVAYNDDSPLVPGLQSTLTNAFVTGPGQYYIAVSGYNNDPNDEFGQLMWANTPFNVERAPDGPGAAGTVASWTGGGASGGYIITLTGACFPGGGGCAPCAADFDQSGGVDGDDITAFFNDWQAGAPCGDVDGSGGVDGDDIPFFFDRWQAGGCN